MRLLQIYPKGDFYTGAAIQLRDLARGLAARGHRVVVVTRPSERWAEEARAAGFVHHGFFRGPADSPGPRGSPAFFAGSGSRSSTLTRAAGAR